MDEGAFRLRKAGDDHEFKLLLRGAFDLVSPYRSSPEGEDGRGGDLGEACVCGEAGG